VVKRFCSKLRAPHRGTSLGSCVWGAKHQEPLVIMATAPPAPHARRLQCRPRRLLLWPQRQQLPRYCSTFQRFGWPGTRTAAARIEALEVNWFGSAQLGDTRARLNALGRELGPSSPAPEPEQAPPTPANSRPLDLASPVSMMLFQSPLSPSVPSGGSSLLSGSSASGESPAVPPTDHGRQGHQPQALRP
jgi:hypothetical protein